MKLDNKFTSQTDLLEQIIFKGIEYIKQDLDHILHPFNKLIRYMIFILSEAYENEFLKFQIIKENDEENIPYQYKTTNFSNKSQNKTSNFNHLNTISSKETDSFNSKNNDEKYITNLNQETRLLTSSSSSNDISSKQDIIINL